MSRWDDAGPPAAAYERVTDPGRFAVLHDAARDLVADLAARYAVDLTASTEKDERFGADLVEVVRLTPVDPEAGPLRVTFTSFPGLAVRLGRWHDEVFPSCGCDACDDDPEELVAELRAAVGALVTGRLAEGVRSAGGERWRWYRRRDSSGGSSGGQPITRGDPEYGLPDTDIRWAAWPLRRA